MGDRTYSSGVTIQTQCFTIKELVFIINVLMIKFRLECSIHTQGNYSVTYIKSRSLKKNLHNMLPYIHPSMLYKFKGPKYKLEKKINIPLFSRLMLLIWQTRGTSWIGNINRSMIIVELSDYAKV